jgi:phosphoglycerate kinase
MKTIKELKNISGKRVLLRADFNVPIKNGKIISTFRIDKTIPTISFLQKKEQDNNHFSPRRQRRRKP